jgi:predicted component of type VI protein secretion system
VAQLFVLSGPDAGKSFELRPGDTVGRSPECIVTLKHASISRRHARFEREGEDWYVVDEGSRNGVVVDHKRVPRARLADRQEFQLGELLLRFRGEAPAAAPASAAPPRAAPPAPPARPAPAAPPAPELPDEIVLEDGDEPPPRRAPSFEPRIDPDLLPTQVSPRVPPPPPPELSRTMLDTGFGRPPAGAAAGASISRAARGAGDRVLQYHKVENRRGLAHAELSQLPLAVRAALAVLALALLAGLAWLAFSGTAALKRRLAGEREVELESR